MPDVLELDLQLLVSHLVWVLGMELWASVRAVPLAVEPLLPFTQAFMWVLRFQVLMLAQLSPLLPMPSSALSPPCHPHPTLIWIVFLQWMASGLEHTTAFFPNPTDCSARGAGGPSKLLLTPSVSHTQTAPPIQRGVLSLTLMEPDQAAAYP